MRQYAAREVPGFPVAVARGGKNYWSPDQIFRYIDLERPQLRHRIPRLYAPAGINPAVFLFAERHTVRLASGAAIDFAVHHWQPSDGRGPVAVAYAGPCAGPAWPFAATLLELLPAVAAVAIVTSEISHVPGHDVWQAALGVAERGQPPFAALGFDRADENVIEMGWYELANLLRQDVPWWSASLRDVDAMISWFPGAPRQRIRPRGRFYDESMLRRLVGHVDQQDAARVSDLADRLNRIFEGRVNDELPTCVEAESAGLVQAGEALYRVAEIPEIPDERQMGWLLRRHVADSLDADVAATMLRSTLALQPLVAYTVDIPPDHGPLAAEWLKECDEVVAPISDELGFALARQAVPPTARVINHCKHPRNPLVWIVKADSGAVYATVGAKVPATGRLCEFEAGKNSAFFRDSNGAVWPMPAPSKGYYRTGYDGSGPTALYFAVNALWLDAACDVSAVREREPEQARSPLWRHIVRTDPPLMVTEDDLGNLLSGSRNGI